MRCCYSLLGFCFCSAVLLRIAPVSERRQARRGQLLHAASQYFYSLFDFCCCSFNFPSKSAHPRREKASTKKREKKRGASGNEQKKKNRRSQDSKKKMKITKEDNSCEKKGKAFLPSWLSTLRCSESQKKKLNGEEGTEKHAQDSWRPESGRNAKQRRWKENAQLRLYGHPVRLSSHLFCSSFFPIAESASAASACLIDMPPNGS